jgi:hypothetical protein
MQPVLPILKIELAFVGKEQLSANRFPTRCTQ